MIEGSHSQLLMVVGWLVVMGGIWHPYVLDVSAPQAAAVASIFTLLGWLIAFR